MRSLVRCHAPASRTPLQHLSYTETAYCTQPEAMACASSVSITELLTRQDTVKAGVWGSGAHSVSRMRVSFSSTMPRTRQDTGYTRKGM